MLNTFKFLIPYLKRYRIKYIAGVFFLLFTNAFRMANPKVVQYSIDYLKQNFVLSDLAKYAGLIIVIALCEGVFSFLMRRSIIVGSREIENDLRNDFFQKLLSLPQSFYNKMPTGEIMSRATNDLSAVRMAVGPGIAYSTNTIMAFLFVIPMMIYISPRLTLIALTPFPLVALLVNRFGKAIYQRFEKVQEQLGKLTTIAQENLSGNTVLKWFTREQYEIEKFRRENEEYMKRSIHHVKVQAAFHPSLALSAGIAIMLIIFFGGQMVIAKTISIGEFTAFMLYAGILIWPFIALGWVIGIFQQGSASLKRMQAVFFAEPDIVEKPNALKPEKLKGEIRFRNLNFGYEPDQPVLKNINLEIAAGQTIGIIGPTGSGKSTLIKLIPHIYALPDGVLQIDGHDINDYAVSALRQHIGYVPQENFLFSTSIRENIAYGNKNATQEEIEWAAEMADIHNQIVEFPDGYGSLLGEKGLNLSGGQKQRISIARAILRKPQILILDDAFSALDTETEDRILKNLTTFFPNRTVILVSHRVSTLQNCDQIVVLENGEIVEKGTHEELIEQGKLYSWIYQKQLLEAELEKTE
jgi:ATP-binding cassette subfamily B protein